MATRKQAQKRTPQNIQNSLSSSPKSPVQTQKSKANDNTNTLEENEDVNLKDIWKMMQEMMTKLDKLDRIEERMTAMNTEIKDIKTSLEYAHDEIEDLKKSDESHQETATANAAQVERLNKEFECQKNAIVDLKARSMRDNLIFYNIKESARENTTKIIHDLLEEKFNIEDASECVKIDRSHRIGKPRMGQTTKPRPIVAKFNYFQDKEYILRNARKLKGTNIGVSEQFPEEIIEIRKKLYPELKKARDEGKKAKLAYNKLIIEGQVFTSNP